MVVTTKDYGKMIRHANIISRVRRGRPAMKTYMYNTTIGKANLFHTPIRKVYNPKKKFKPGKKIKKHEWINKYQPGATQRAYIKPKRFLELTPITHNPIATSPQTKRLEKELIESGRVDSGFLDVNTNKRSANYGKVTGHEGRHRAYVLWKRGIKTMPIKIFHAKGHKKAINRIKLSRLTPQHPDEPSAWDSVKTGKGRSAYNKENK